MLNFFCSMWVMIPAEEVVRISSSSQHSHGRHRETSFVPFLVSPVSLGFFQGFTGDAGPEIEVLFADITKVR